jgi:EmrB/QacA subfamily drug resistance transporter
VGRNEERAFERRWLILAVLCFSLLIIVLDNSILNVAIPTIVRDLGASNSQVQWMIDSYTLVFACLLLTAGSLGDRFGRRGALLIGFLIFGLGSVASSLAQNSNQLIATRAVMGIGGALIMPATLSIITNVFPREERGKAIGVWAGTAGLGAALGPLTGGLLLTHFYWGSVFLVNLPIVIFGIIAGFLIIPTSKDPSAPRLDPVGALLSIVGLTALLFGIIQAPSEGWTSPLILASFAAGIVLMVAFTLWERHSDHPMLNVEFFKNPRFTAASGSITLIFFAMFGSIFLLTQYLQFVLGYSPLESGVRLLPMALTLMVVAPLSPRMVKRFGTKVTVVFGLLLVTFALLAFGTLQVDSSYGSIAWRLIIMAAGMGLVMAPATDSVMGSLPLAKAGVGSAVNDTTRQVGGALGVAIIGSVLSSTYGSAMGTFFAGTPAPPEAVEAAQNQLGAVTVVADKLAAAPVPGAQQLASNLVATANQAFVSGMHWGVLVAAAATLIGAIIAGLFLPALARDGDDYDEPEVSVSPNGKADMAHAEPEPAGSNGKTPVSDRTPDLVAD